MNGNDATVYNLEQHTPKSVINVAVLGAESTGKTTLCRDLAAHFDNPWVSEYMRTYLQAKWDDEQLTCTWEDLLPIAQGQITLENTLAKQVAQTSNASHYLFCDTSLFELMVYSYWYYDDCPTALEQAALAHHSKLGRQNPRHTRCTPSPGDEKSLPYTHSLHRCRPRGTG